MPISLVIGSRVRISLIDKSIKLIRITIFPFPTKGNEYVEVIVNPITTTDSGFSAYYIAEIPDDVLSLCILSGIKTYTLPFVPEGLVEILDDNGCCVMNLKLTDGLADFVKYLG